MVTNNPRVKDKYENVHFVEGSFLDVLISVRDLVHKDFVLVSHPLGASIRMLFSPYRSIIVGEKVEEIDVFSVEIIENSIISYKKHMEVRNADWDNKEDYQLIDNELLESTLKSLNSNSCESCI
ncbi:GrdX family protein [Sporanaerobacter sp.]|uniref:GrdX family protein n=1 Tax=Sporanaerobacter sp. TaxID=2010183 RepID=UPI003A0FFC39